MVGDRRVSAADVNRYAADMQREISALEERLQSLRSAVSASSAMLPARRGPGRPRRRARTLTPEQRASRQLQGRYLGLIRQIPANRRAQYAKIVKERGREAAIKEIKGALNKK